MVACTNTPYHKKTNAHKNPMCAFIFLQKALFVHGGPIFLGRQAKKKCKKIPVRKQWKLNLRQQKCVSRHISLDHHCALMYHCSGTMYKPRDEIFFLKIERYFTFPHECNY